MRLKNKLLVGILFTLLLQIGLSGGFTIFTFINQTRMLSEEELISGWKRARYALERLKHRLYREIITFPLFTQLDFSPSVSPDSLEIVAGNFIGNSEADSLLIMDKKRNKLVDIQRGIPGELLLPIEIIDFDDFRFPRNAFYSIKTARGGRMLFLVTGVTFEAGGERYIVCLIKKIDKNFAIALKEEVGINIAFFADGEFICSDLPEFAFRKQAETVTEQTKISDVPHILFSRIISTDVRELSLVVLKSLLNQKIYLRQLITSFAIAFIITFIFSVMIAAVMTTYFISPFSRLYRWLEGYLQTGEANALDIHTGDEVGFLAKTFHRIVGKLIEEENVIRKQLTEISFLHHYTETIVSNLQAGVFVVREDSRIEFCNQYAQDILCTDMESIKNRKIDEVLNECFIGQGNSSNFPDIFHPELDEADNTILKVKGKGEMRFVVKVISLGEDSEERKYLVMLEDITRTERLWQRLLVAEKISSLGFLAAGMAHEINNPLGSILSHVNFLAACEQDEEKIDSLQWIEKEIRRIETIIKRILSFSRCSTNHVLGSDLNQVISDVLQLARYELEKKTITVDYLPDRDLSPVKIHPEELKQVILNLIINALQAIDHKGSIKIITMQREKDIIVSVVDTGMGIPPEEINNIFDPFYTTRVSGFGMGLGLYISYVIIKRAGGDIQVESTQGESTRVTVTLPISEESL